MVKFCNKKTSLFVTKAHPLEMIAHHCLIRYLRLCAADPSASPDFRELETAKKPSRGRFGGCIESKLPDTGRVVG
jgi:hypothetical protein